MENLKDAEKLHYWIKKVSEEFYARVYEDPWLKQVFGSIPQEHITAQQIDFMLAAFGGPDRYQGRRPQDAHPHIFVSEEMWQERERYLTQAFQTTGCPLELAEKWLRIDLAFKKQIVMSSPEECQRRFATDDLIIVPRPKKAA